MIELRKRKIHLVGIDRDFKFFKYFLVASVISCTIHLLGCHITPANEN